MCDEVVFLTEAMIELDYYKRFVATWGNRKYLGKEAMAQQSMMNELNDVADRYFYSGFYSNAHFKFISEAYIPAASNLERFYMVIDDDFVDWTKEIAKTETIKDFMLTVQAGNALLQKDLENFEKYSIHVNHEYLLDRLMQEYKIVRTNMVNPENISAYILGNLKDFTNNVSLDDQNLLAKIITPNYGKVQMINICASWCPPCKIVLEQLGALMKEYADKNVHFSFICITPDNKETREMYREKGIDDTFVYFTTNDEYLFLANTFSPMAFPYGVLVNKKGIIVDYGTHVRPLNELFLGKLNLLLEQDKLIK